MHNKITRRPLEALDLAGYEVDKSSNAKAKANFRDDTSLSFFEEDAKSPVLAEWMRASRVRWKPACFSDTDE